MEIDLKERNHILLALIISMKQCIGFIEGHNKRNPNEPDVKDITELEELNDLYKKVSGWDTGAICYEKHYKLGAYADESTR